MAFEIDLNKFRASVQALLLALPLKSDKRVLENFLGIQVYTEKDIAAFLNHLSERLLDTSYTELIGLTFEQYLLLILSVAIPTDEDIQIYQIYHRKCVALAKLMQFSLDAQRYAINYFRNKPAPFETAFDAKLSKNPKNLSNAEDTLTLVKCCYQLLYINPSYFKDIWNWSTFVEHHWQYTQSANDLQQVYSNYIIAILTNMTTTQLSKLNYGVPAEVLVQFDSEMHERAHLETTVVQYTPHIMNYHIKSEVVTNVEGVLLSIFNKENYKFYTQADENIVRVDSTKANLRSIALGIFSGRAICLSGPVGCGKTTLVEYLARKTGRLYPKVQEILHQQQGSKENQEDRVQNSRKKCEQDEMFKASDFNRKRKSELKTLEFSSIRTKKKTNGYLRIQLGDQTDSKMLLGQYRCTDVPGEFIWLPGVLTQAVMNGYWLLLEDLDAGTQDTYAIISDLLENNFLSVPGFRDCVKIEPGFQLFMTVRTNQANTGQKSLFSLLEKYLYNISILPLSRNELCKVISTNYPKLSTVANRIVEVFLTFSSGKHDVADYLQQQEQYDKRNGTEYYMALPVEGPSLTTMPNSGRLVSTRDLIKLCERSNPVFSVTSTECAYFVFQNAVDVFCSYLPQGKEKTKLITSIGAKLGIIQSRCEHFADEYKPEVLVGTELIKIGRAEFHIKELNLEYTKEEHIASQSIKRQKLSLTTDKVLTYRANKNPSTTFSFTRMASCILERIAVCVVHGEPVLLVGETGVGKTSSVQYLAESTNHKLVVINMNNQSDVSDLVGGFKPVDLMHVVAPLRGKFEKLFRQTFNEVKNEIFLTKFSICYNQNNFSVLIKLMLKVANSVDEKARRKELGPSELKLLPRWHVLRIDLLKLHTQLSKSLNISFAFISGSLVNCIKHGAWVLLDEINLASAETLECLSTILEPNGSVVLLEKGDLTPVKRHPDFRIFACMNPNTDIGKKDLAVGIRNRFTEFFVDELTTDADLSMLVSDYLNSTGIQRKSVTSIVKLYKRLKQMSRLELNDGLGNQPNFSLRTLCRSLRVCAKNLCGSIERNIYESFSMAFLTQLDAVSHKVVVKLIQDALLSNAKAVLRQSIPQPGENYLNFEGYWIQQGPKVPQECSNYIMTPSVRKNLQDLVRIISIGKLPILLQGPTSAGKTSLIEYVAKRSGNQCLRLNNHEHTDLQEYIGNYVADDSGKLSFMEGVLVQAMRNGYWIILDELNLASTDILEALNRVLDDNRELFIPETQTVVKALPNFMLFATQNPPGLYGGRKTLSRAFKNRFIELHFGEIPRAELEIILEKRCLIPSSYAKKMVMCMSDLQKNHKSTVKNMFTLRDLFRWGNRYTYADKRLLENQQYDWNQHLIEEGYLVLSAKVRTTIEIELVEAALHRNFRKHIEMTNLFDTQSKLTISPVTAAIIDAIRAFKQRTDVVWTKNMTRMAVLTAKALQFDEPVLLVGPTGCGKTTVCQILSTIHDVRLRTLNCHMHTESADFLGGLRPCRQSGHPDRPKKLFEWSDGPLIQAMQDGSYFMADEISLAEDSVLERLNCILESDRTILLSEKGGVVIGHTSTTDKECAVQARAGFQFLATMNPGGDFGKKELSPALRNRFTEIWCLPSDAKDDLIQIASNCMLVSWKTFGIGASKDHICNIAVYLVEVVLYIRDVVEKFKFSIRDILAWANYIVINAHLSFPEKAIFGLETIFLDALEMLPHESLEQVDRLKATIIEYAIQNAAHILGERFTIQELALKRGTEVLHEQFQFGIKPFFIASNSATSDVMPNRNFLFEAPTTKNNLFRLLSALSLKKPVLLEGPPGVGKTSIVESLGQAIGYRVVRINLCEHTDLADLFGTDLPADDNILQAKTRGEKPLLNNVGAFMWRDGPLLAALKTANAWILLDELNLAPQSVLEGLNAILDHRGEVYIPELNRTFKVSQQTRIFAAQNPVRQGGARKGLPQSFLNRFNKVYLRKLSTEDLLYVVRNKYEAFFELWRLHFSELLRNCTNVDACNIFVLYKTKCSGLKFSQKTNNAVNHVVVFDLCERLVQFSELLDRGIANMEFGYKGGPYEINLRDILRWCDLLSNPATGPIFGCGKGSNEAMFLRQFESFLLTLYERMKLVYYQRMRCDQDKSYIRNTFASVFQCDAELLNALSEDVAFYWTDERIYLNDIVLQRDGSIDNGIAPCSPSIHKAPLLLSSQREFLKNVIECVHIEKPVLLCGSTDTGKTKLIDTLCTLSHQICRTDTIDDSVTGSFQQIDLNRHLEEISQNVHTILMKFLQSIIFENSPYSTEYLSELLNAWSTYRVYSDTISEFSETTAISEELLTFRQRIHNLNIVIKQMMSRAGTSTVKPHHSQLNEQQQLLNALKRHTDRAESLNTGGSFEWVDSKIVTSLKCGQYLLLEHVNLCSSAVLDRLNPVFEPNGKLLISEKGVTTTKGTADVVIKAPNFRAFLTLDPRNGELSRAMRNRCIELSLAKQSTYDVDDLRLIVHSLGVHNVHAINAILGIHERVICVTEINHYSLSHLTQFAFLVTAYERIGFPMDRAIYVSGMEVYVYAAHTDLMGYGLAFFQNKLRDIVITGSRRLGALPEDQQNTVDVMADVALNSLELNDVTRIRQQTVPLKVILQYKNDIPQQRLADLYADFANINLRDINRAQLLRYLVYMMYECSSMADIYVRHCKLEQMLLLEPSLLKLSLCFYHHVEASRSAFCATLWQLPWNNRLLPRIRDYTPSKVQETNQATFRLSATLITQLLLYDVPHHKGITRIYQLSALAYSQSLAAGVITDKFNNTLLEHFATFITRLPVLLREAIAVGEFQSESQVQLTTAVLWFNRLLKTSMAKLYIGKEINVELLPKLVLHIKWLNKHLLKFVSNVAPNYQQSCGVEYESSLQKVVNYVLNIRHPLNFMSKIYNKQLTHFQPFYQAEQIQLYAHALDIDEMLGLVPSYGAHSFDLVLHKLYAQRSDVAHQVRNILRTHNLQLLDYIFDEVRLNVDHVAHMPAALNAALLEFANALKDLEMPPLVQCDNTELLEPLVAALGKLVYTKDPFIEKLTDTEIAMQLLREYYITKTLVYTLAHHGGRSKETNFNMKYCEQVLTMSTSSWHLIQLMHSTKYTAHAKVWSELNVYLCSRDTDTAAFGHLLSYLNGSYKQFSTYYRLIVHAMVKQQMSSASGHLDCSTLFDGKEESREINCVSVYRGPALTNTLIALLYQSDGSAKSIPLIDLQLWRCALGEMQQLLWHNAQQLTPSHGLLSNNLIIAQQSATRLLFEVEHVRKLCANLENENFSDYSDDFNRLVQTLGTELIYVDTATDEYVQQQHVQYQTAMLYALIGAIELCLLTFTPLIDPVEKNRLKTAYIIEDINCLNTLSTVYDFMRIVHKYKHYGAEVYDALGKRLQMLRIQQSKYTRKMAKRPMTCLYSCLVKDIAHFLQTNCEPQVLLSLMVNTRDLWLDFNGDSSRGFPSASLDSLGETLSKIELWLTNAQHFISHILKRYMKHYQDFVQPLRCSVDQLRFGFEGLKVLLTQIGATNVEGQRNESAPIHSHTNVNISRHLHRLLANIGAFPTAMDLNIFNVHSAQEMLQKRAFIFKILKPVPGGDMDYFSLLRTKLVELQNRIAIAGTINESTFVELDFAFNLYNQIWLDDEERRRQQKAEDDSLYKTKCVTVNEDLLELQEVTELFPTNVEDDFGEFLVEETLEEVKQLDKDPKPKCPYVVRDRDYTFIIQKFVQIMQRYTHTNYYRPVASTKQISLEFVEPFCERMQVFIKLYSHYRAALNEWVDEALYNSFSFAVGLQQQLFNTINGSSADIAQDAYNFYKDPNIKEITTCAELLERIEQRVCEQIALYPEHASLVDMKRVLQRIRSLPATAPVVRFCSGFQLLRKKIAQWNEVAHSDNHLRQEEIDVAKYVQRWTRLELQFWRSCLAETDERVQAEAHRYWFFIYNLLLEYLRGAPLDNSYTNIKCTERRFIDRDLLDVDTDLKTARALTSAADVVRILRQFMEASTYGDYHVRMQLLQSFELYLHHRQSKPSTSLDAVNGQSEMQLITGLHNLHIYFGQFALDIEEAKRGMRAPIEKKLKELVKIESYNKDLSYFSMRNNVARVHRQLNKFLKEYQTALQKKMTPLFQPRDDKIKDHGCDQNRRKYTSDSYHQLEAKLFVLTRQPDDKQGSGEKLLQRIAKLFAISRDVVFKTVSATGYPQLIAALECLLDGHLLRAEYLRNLTVDYNADRTKQRIEAKNILQRKRKGLSDLFRTLGQLGVSFKAGLMELSLCTEFETFTLTPFCVHTTLGIGDAATTNKPLHRHLLHFSNNLDHYYAKCILKLEMLQRVMLIPPLELGPSNIERIKGYAIDFFLLVQQQRKLLAETTISIYGLRKTLQELRELSTICEAPAHATELAFSMHRDSYLRLKDSMCRIRLVVEQFRLLLTYAPVDQEDENVVIMSTHSLLRNSQKFVLVSKLTEEILELAQQTMAKMTVDDNRDFLSYSTLSSYKAAHKELQSLLQQLRDNFRASTHDEYDVCVKPINDLLNLIEKNAEYRDKINRDVEPPLHTSFEHMDADLENILHATLLALQKLYNKYTKTESPIVDNAEPGENYVELQDQHLKSKLHAELIADWNTLAVSTHNKHLNNVLLVMKHSAATPEKLQYLHKLVALLPLLEQYGLMSDYYLCQQLGAHKVSVKMLSVLLTVFVELSRKGFCVPADLMQDEEGQAKQKGEGESFGLEDGSGEKDVSDKIDSEDQLEDAKRPEDRKDVGENQQNDDCKEEKGIEMSEDFDDGKIQDIEKPESEEDDHNESEEEKDLTKEMGETDEGAEKLDDQIWGDENEPETENENELNEEEGGTGSQKEKDAHNELNAKPEVAKNNAADDDKDRGEHDKDALDATNDPSKNDKDKSKTQKTDIDNMTSPEGDEDQVNACHNELEEPPEPEDMDLGDMKNVDAEPAESDGQQNDDNPFDIDTMKENMHTADEQDVHEDPMEDNKNDDAEDDKSAIGSDSENDDDSNTAEQQADVDGNEGKVDNEENAITHKHTELNVQVEADKEEQAKDEEEAQCDEKPEKHGQSKDNNVTKEENIQSVPEKEGSTDKGEQAENDVMQDHKLDEQNTGKEKDGVGLAENEETSEGHQGIAETKQSIKQEDHRKEQRNLEKRQQGKTNEDRTLGEAETNTLKQLKTIDKFNGQDNEDVNKTLDIKELADKDIEAEEYQHVKDPMHGDKTTLDNATEEQSKQVDYQKSKDETMEDDDQTDNDDDVKAIYDEEDHVEGKDDSFEQMEAENLGDNSDKLSKLEKSKERTKTREELIVEGEIVATTMVSRSDDTTAHCINELLNDTSSHVPEPPVAESLELRRLYQHQLITGRIMLPLPENYENWQSINNRMSQNARELCEQLRLILEPTKCTRLKGDYRSGRRINMKKIIPYIASQFRKDKIWLRRTKPAQRDYKISIAIDDSKSMHHNNSKILTLEAISMVSQALMLLESGRLSILSFGEAPQLILTPTEQFDGPKLVKSLNFAQNKTKIAELLDFMRAANTEEGSTSDNGLFENLLLILSDGRNIFCEGKPKVQNAIKLARLQRIFLVYIIIDNPENKNSILDIQTMEMLPDKSISIKSYLDDFPFPYYVIVRDLSQLPQVLSEAMRQWFELVNSEQ